METKRSFVGMYMYLVGDAVPCREHRGSVNKNNIFSFILVIDFFFICESPCLDDVDETMAHVGGDCSTADG